MSPHCDTVCSRNCLGVGQLDPVYGPENPETTQEALVLTLFGKYIGTLKGAGFCVNPFCQAVNPAAQTHWGQSGDVKSVDEKFC